jgi:hypothetical protein
MTNTPATVADIGHLVMYYQQGWRHGVLQKLGVVATINHPTQGKQRVPAVDVFSLVNPAVK